MKFALGFLAIIFGFGCFIAGLSIMPSAPAKAQELQDSSRRSIKLHSSGLEYEIIAVKGHDYLFLWNYVRGCCVIHAESCPCRSGARTN